MKHRSWKGAHTLGLATALTLASLSGAPAQQGAAPPPIKIGIVTFLTGPAAAPFGDPGPQRAPKSWSRISTPARSRRPTTQVGLGGAKIEVKYVDEAGSTAQDVTEYRNLVQRDNVDVVRRLRLVGQVASPSCRSPRNCRSSRCSMSAARRASSRRSRANTCSASIRTPPWITWRRRNTRSRNSRTSRSIPASTRITPGARIPGATSIWR